MTREEAILLLRRRANESLQAIENATAESVADVVNLVITRLVAYLEASPDADAEEMVTVLSDLIEDGAARGADFMVAMGDQILDTSTTAQAQVASRLGVTTANEAITSAAIWSDEHRIELLSDAHRRWYGRLKNEALHPGGALREALEGANVWGDSMREAAQKLIKADPDLSSFPPLAMDVEARARMIIRTESTRFDTAVSVGIAEDSGLTHFVNAGIGDTRQSDVCERASKMRPMTIEEWAASDVGPPPRHPNCRCVLIGVPTGYRATQAEKERAGVL